MKNYILINQKFSLASDATISIYERACRFGDGIFESCKIIDGIIYDYEAHEARIIRGLKALKISADIKNLQNDSYHLIQKNQLKNGTLRISISRGIGSIGYLPTHETAALVIVETTAAQNSLPEKIKLGISSIKVAKQQEFLQKCKTMQGLNYILAKIAAREKNNFDDVMLSHEGFVSECSSANIFWIKNHKIFTPSKKCDMLFGTIREKLLQKFPQKINAVEASVTRLVGADEIFITNANLLLLPIDELIFGKNNEKKIKLKKTQSSQILQWLQDDIEKYKLEKCHDKK